jgi:hypothetical protein
MSQELPPQLIKHFQNLRRVVFREDYVSKLRPFDVDPQSEVSKVSTSDEFRTHLKRLGLTRGETAGVSHILGNLWFSPDPNGDSTYFIKIVDLQKMTDEQLATFNYHSDRISISQKRVSVVRALFPPSS